MWQRVVLEADIAGSPAPADLFSTLFADEPLAFWLDSASSGTSYLGRGTRYVTASVADGTITVDGVTSPGTIFDFLESERSAVAPGTGFRLGWVGWLGFELRAQTMGMSLSGHASRPDAALIYVESAVAFDNVEHRVRVMALDADVLTELSVRVRGPLLRAEPAEPLAGAVSWRYTDDEYLRMIADCQAAIVEGEAYQLCLTNEVSVDIHPDPFRTYLSLRQSSPSHHGAYFRAGDVALLSASPEEFLTVTPDGLIESKPIKGTRPRGASADEDAALAAELLASDKERAENLMIVDLMRNDIARVSATGSVSVPSLNALESYAHVHQLVSTVRGQLAPGLSAIDAVVACFPAGSMTGAPKRRAIEILQGLEGRQRGIYSGAFGYFSLDGRVDLAMVIRSIVLDGQGATVGTGGGITALSIPLEELAEAKLKAAALLAVLGAG